MRCRLFAALVLLLAASLSSQTAPAPAPKPSPDAAPVLTVADRQGNYPQGTQSYYSLKAEGLIEFQCQVLPDWDAIYKDQPLDPLGRDQLLPVLKKTYFQVVFTPEPPQPSPLIPRSHRRTKTSPTVSRRPPTICGKSSWDS